MVKLCSTLEHKNFQCWRKFLQRWFPEQSNIGQQVSNIGLPYFPKMLKLCLQHWFAAQSNIGQQMSNIGPLKFPVLDKMFPKSSYCTIQDWTTGFQHWTTEISHVARSVSNTGLMGFRLLEYTTFHFKFFFPVFKCVKIYFKKSHEKQVSEV